MAVTNRPKGGGKLLWVDDKPEGNAFEIAELRSIGMHVDLAKTGQEALQIFSDSEPPCDLLLSDVGRIEDGSYKRLAGLELLQQLRSSGTTVPVLFCKSASGAAQADPRRHKG